MCTDSGSSEMGCAPILVHQHTHVLALLWGEALYTNETFLHNLVYDDFVSGVYDHFVCVCVAGVTCAIFVRLTLCHRVQCLGS